MNKHLLRCFCVLVAVPTLGSCQPSPDARLTLQKAIAAHGGEEAIKKPRKGKLTAIDKGRFSSASIEEVFDLPKQWKRTVVITFDSKRKTGVTLMVDGKCWQWEPGGEVKDADATGAASQFGTVTGLLEISEKCQVTPIPGIKVNGRPAVGLHAESPSMHGDYYFDRQTGLLVQSNFTWGPQAGQQFLTQQIFEDHKAVDGIKLAFRRKTYVMPPGAKEYSLGTDMHIRKIEMLEKLPEDVFSLPDN